MKRIFTLAGLIILLALVSIAVAVLVSRSVANHKADEIMRPTFNEGWVRKSTRLGLWVNEKFQPMWLVEYDNNSERAFIDFGPQFGINPFGKIIYISPRDLVERIERNKLSLEQIGPAYRR